MKYLVFWSLLLFTSFVLILNFEAYQDATADSIFRGSNYLEMYHPDGSITRVVGLTPYIYDGNSYVPFISNGTTIETEHNSVILNPNGTYSVYKHGVINGTPLLTDTIVAKYADISNLNSWTYPNTLNNDTPEISWNGSTLTSSRLKNTVGLLDYKYVLNDGKWKTHLEATNLSGLTTKAFGFDQIIDLNSDTIKFGGVTRNLDNFNGTTFDKIFLVNNQGKIIDMLNGIYFDFDLGFDNLYSITVYDTGANKSRLVFDYRTNTPLQPNETLIIDPTFGNLGSTVYRALTSNSADNNCNSGNTIDSTSTIYKGANTGADNCRVFALSFDVSGFPDTAVITDTTFGYTAGAPTNAINCDIKPMATDPSGLSASALYTDITDGVAYVSNDNTCTTAGAKTEDLGATADTNLQTAITGDDVFAFGVSFNSMTRDASTHSIPITLPVLLVTYNMPPDPPKLTNSTVTSSAVTTYWSAPATNGGSGTVTYDIQRSTDGAVFTSQSIQSTLSYTDTWPFSVIEDYAYYRVYSNDTLGYSEGYSFPLNQTISPDVLTHLPYDNTLTDQGTHTNTPTTTGTQLYTPGHNGMARLFDGSSYDSMANESEFDFNATDPYSISFWAYPATGVSTFDMFLAKGTEVSTIAGIYLQYIQSTKNVEFRMNDAVDNYRAATTTNNITEDSWYHFVFTYSGNSDRSGMKIYVNGVLAATGSAKAITGSLLNNNNLVIGAESDGDRAFNGYIDDLFVITKELDANEVEQIYYERLDVSALVPPVTYATSPTLIATAESTTQIDLDWTAPSMTNINGYRIQRETPIGTGWGTINSNTTTTTLYYNNTGLSTNIIYNYRVYALNGTGLSQASNEYDMTTFHLPDAVDDLSGVATDFSTVELSWTAPTSYAPEITGYRVNYTSPEGDPQTIITPDPYTTTISAILYGLQIGEEYSFRVAPITVHGTNASGNIFNVTSINPYPPGNLTSGDTTNTDDFQIFFERDDINATSLYLNVTYSDTYDLNCNFAYQFARTNDTYANLTSTVIDADNVESSFLFVNATGDVIHVKCWDTITDDEARYVLTITDFPFLDQISNMRNGTYGTYFQIGAIDGVTLMIVVLAMIGFNRTNPVLGIVFLVITVGVLSFFDIITYPIIMYPALALLMVWAFISTRKDD